MIAVIFEVEPTEGRKDEYLDIAAEMRPLLGQIDGFISVERFQSLTDPRKILSLSFFEDEDAIATLLEYNFSKEGYDVGVARDGEAGLSAARAERPDLLVLDEGDH